MIPTLGIAFVLTLLGVRLYINRRVDGDMINVVLLVVFFACGLVLLAGVEPNAMSFWEGDQ